MYMSASIGSKGSIIHGGAFEISLLANRGYGTMSLWVNGNSENGEGTSERDDEDEYSSWHP